MVTLDFYLQWRQDLGSVQAEALSGAYSFLKESVGSFWGISNIAIGKQRPTRTYYI
jgi:hypothetical protein